jgi:anti-sigma B factor antagonist
MQIQVVRRDGVTVLELVGSFERIDVDAASDLLNELFVAHEHRLVADLGRLSLVDSSGLGWLLLAQATARRHGGDLVLARPSQFHASVLKTLGLDRKFCICGSVDDGVRSVSNPPSVPPPV